MSGLNPNRYPVDLQGTETTNLIVGELITLPIKKVRVFSPRNAPFFAESLVIVDMSTGLTLSVSQYKCLYLTAAASALSGKPIFALVAITDQAVGTQLQIRYQTVGGDFVQSFETITALIDTLTSDTRPASWDNIVNRQDVFNPTQHMHPVGQTMGWEYLAFALQTVSTALLLGDSYKKDFILHYIDTMLGNSNATTEATLDASSVFGQHMAEPNAHGVTPALIGLDKIHNYAVATSQQAMEGTRQDLYVTVDVLAAVIQSAVNGGMDAHVGRTDNPHSTDAAQVGLGNVLNYPEALAADFTTPDVDNKKYVTNVSLAAWLATTMAALNTAYTNSLAGINTSLTGLATQATNASNQAAAATTAANQATANTQLAVTAAAAALTLAQTNAQEIDASQAAAQALITQYTAAAVAAADAAGYSRGYADGVAA